MISTKHKLKINNSYESEPSSGSGSSLGEQHEGPVSDDENIHFPYLMKPTVIDPTTIITYRRKTRNLQQNDVSIVSTDSSYTEDESANNANKKRQLKFGRPANSSQESPFEGFNDSPFGGLRQQIYCNDQVKPLKLPEPGEDDQPTPGKLTFPKYYDTIVEENSCNAVDIKLFNEPVISRKSSTSNDSNVNDLNPSGELSFNGKIPSLNCANETVKPEESQCKPTYSNMEAPLNTSQLTESFILKKYSNERSPDLFGDDEDEDESAGDHADVDTSTNVEVNSCAKQLDDIVEAKEDALDGSVNRSFICPTESSIADDPTFDCSGFQMTSTDDPATLFRNNCRREREMLRLIRKCLAGVPPPPSLTIPQLDMFSTVLNKKTEILNFLQNDSSEDQASSVSCQTKSIFKPTHSEEITKSMGWREVLGVRQLGLCYNLNKASENNEYLSLAVIERFIGAETASSYRSSPSSAKKRNCRLNKLLTQSPGNRLSHLAKRRAIFSSANLATTSLKTSTSLGPQILIDKKKPKNRRKATPKRMTPGSKKKTVRKTPSSSARKRLFRSDLCKPGPSRETSKRALFQSPAKQQLQQKAAPPKPVIKPEIANRVEKSKRALFPPETGAESNVINNPIATQYAPVITPQLESLLKRKRSCVEEEDEITTQSSKLFRASGEKLTPRALKIKSQSFCIGAGSSTSNAATNASLQALQQHSQSFVQGSKSTNNFANAFGGKVLQRAHSDMAAPANNLTENQRKKLLWAVSQALQEKKITAKHESFKQYASVLARVVRRIFTEYYQKTSTSNSETMLRLAKKYAFHVISGKNLDDIYLQAKSNIDDSKRQSNVRLSGYIGPAEFEQRKQLSQQLLQQTQNSSSQYSGSLQNLFATENSIDSFSMSMSQSSSVFCANAANNSVSISQSQTSFHDRLSQDMLSTQNSLCKSASKQQPIITNTTLQNSSSKSNLGPLALRENADGELRRSAQKNFTGKDQRNVSPYTAGALLGSGRKVQSEIVRSELPGIGCKVKRQITFDS